MKKNSCLIRLAKQHLNSPPAAVGALLGRAIPPSCPQNHHYHSLPYLFQWPHHLSSSHPIHSRTFAHTINDLRRLCRLNLKPTLIPRPKELPEWVSKSVMVLSCDSSAEDRICHVYVVGSEHGSSKKSCMEVEAVMDCVKPQAVFLELCSDREGMLTTEFVGFGFLHESEFRVASEEARKYGSKVILGDRPNQITYRRIISKMPLPHNIKFALYSIFDFVPFSAEIAMAEKNGWDSDAIAIVIQELSKEFPSLVEAWVHERDQYMSSKLLEVASTSSSVVAVVGRAHVPGIKKHWKQPIEMGYLLEVPSSPWAKLKFSAFRHLFPFPRKN
ncbi:hypothetical protein Tsubulata_034689 [Turnera subulata]|uniref:Uncharacterized protein n=1 Tax=Turnera subulata TaxID=218843 RepID=A0A9Q0G3U4_9ROSI|nr:hypothetical protein Tsubulata_034689 [Turnera subulata]